MSTLHYKRVLASMNRPYDHARKSSTNDSHPSSAGSNTARPWPCPLHHCIAERPPLTAAWLNPIPAKQHPVKTPLCCTLSTPTPPPPFCEHTRPGCDLRSTCRGARPRSRAGPPPTSCLARTNRDSLPCHCQYVAPRPPPTTLQQAPAAQPPPHSRPPRRPPPRHGAPRPASAAPLAAPRGAPRTPRSP